MMNEAAKTEEQFMTSFGFLAAGYQNERKSVKKKSDRREGRKVNKWRVGDPLKRQLLKEKIKANAQTFYVVKLLEYLWLVILISLL